LKKLDIFNQMPEMIVIDLPLNVNELSSFKQWLKSTFSMYVPVVYHSEGLEKSIIKELFKNNWVDDVVNLSTHFDTLPEKARFLKKMYPQVVKVKSTPVKQRKHPIKRYSFLHRSIDFTLALIAIIICLPVFMLIAIAIKLESRGPIFYNALRAGKGYKVFRFFKFRTMEVNADKKVKDLSALNQYGETVSGPNFFKVKNDPRITKVGAFLRNTSLDELPQLFNVLIGDMSFVGNRPLPLYEAISLTTDEWAERFMAPAGITGLWQISRRGKEDMSPTERISLDIDYARNRSLAGDMKILLKTPTVLIQKANV
jgi:lipopolysaccharide/colanic/teichoic acid biosynthesis glycosyltransferase